ncbi:hypothetical protein J4G33_04580 [Actinotalea sp. BY-33]|uniref:Uncharacterized protein n=1 Tax=Actinotalea soli TaxID=2819234 RepID=A0A939RTF7_9CELL|nr:hypothetical protein [Actinotalea soli]MBO1751074.1 hypothetical protein [Actinotalea soli]
MSKLRVATVLVIIGTVLIVIGTVVLITSADGAPLAAVPGLLLLFIAWPALVRYRRSHGKARD